MDIPFTLEETEGVIKSLKPGKAGGLNHLQAEHLKYRGNSMVLWIQQVCNAIVELEVIPNVLKMGIVDLQGQWKRPTGHKQLLWN